MNNEEIKIESGIPITGYFREGNTLTSVLRRMNNGDSFVLSANRRGGVVACARNAKLKIVTHKINDTQIRVWRIE